MRLALGTVQFGLAYGIAGRGNAVPESEVRAILEDAADAGVTTLDTAAAYGDIEVRLARLAAGLPLGFVSKVPAIDDTLDPAAAASFALYAARRSRERLGKSLQGLMTHRAQDLEGPRGEAVWNALAPWARAEGVALGASCYDPLEAAALARRPGIALCQLPGNVLDQRIDRPEAVSALGRVDVHLRSVFLQGLLLMPPVQAAARLPVAAPAIARWHEWSAAHHLTPLEAALAVAKSFRAVSTVVVGVDNLAQWRAIAAAWRTVPPMPARELAVDRSGVIDPRLWSLEA